MSSSSHNSAQAHWAHIVQATINASKQWSEQQTAAGIRTLHTQLDAVTAGPMADAFQNLSDLQQDLARTWSQQQASTLSAISSRTQACASDLRRAQTKDEVGIVMAGYANDVGTHVREQLEQTMTLLNSASAASEVLVQKTLTQMTAGAPPK